MHWNINFTKSVIILYTITTTLKAKPSMNDAQEHVNGCEFHEKSNSISK